MNERALRETPAPSPSLPTLPVLKEPVPVPVPVPRASASRMDPSVHPDPPSPHLPTRVAAEVEVATVMSQITGHPLPARTHASTHERR